MIHSGMIPVLLARAAQLLPLLALAAAACDRGAPDCPTGQFPRNGACVSIGDQDAGEPSDDDGGRPPLNDRGQPPEAPDGGDAMIADADSGFVEPYDGAIFDSGYIPEEPTVTAGARDRILLYGNVVLPMGNENEIAEGEVYVAAGRIACVGARGACAAMSEGASIVDTKGVIMPGLVDSHNHVAYNWLPEFITGRTWIDHSDWQDSFEYETFIEPYRENSGTAASFCAMVQWGELRAMVAGTTTLYGAVATRTCFRWLVRNAELSPGYNGFSGDRMRSNVLGIDTVDETAAAALIADMEAGDVTAYMVHVSEGVSDRTKREFDEVERLNLLRPETVIIHGTALGQTEFDKMGAAGMKLVWSPSSNLALYGVTTDVAAAKAAGVPISIAPDWTPSGVDIPLAELRVARQWIAENEPGLFSERELVDAVTSVAASNMALDSEVGRIAVGLHADLLVLAVPPGEPYHSVIEARSGDVRLVMIGGVPTFGDPAIMNAMAEAPPSCHDFVVCGAPRRACWSDPGSGGPVSPESIAAVITSFYAGGPFELFRCN